MANATTLSGTPTYGTGKFGQALTSGSLLATVASNADGVGYTVEGWFQLPYYGAPRTMFGFKTSAGALWQVGVNAGGTLLVGSTSGASVSTGVWHHVVLQMAWSGNNNGFAGELWLDGAFQAEFSTGSSDRIISQLSIGNNIGGTQEWVGFCDEVRVSRGWRYGAYSNFTPPAAAFSNDGSTLALYHLDGDGTDSGGPDAIGQISGLTSRYRADSITGVADGGTVAAWPDSSGNGYGASGGNSPTFVANAINGQPGVRFQASQAQNLRSSAPAGDQTQTVVAVVIPTSTGGTIRGASDNNGLQVRLSNGPAGGAGTMPQNVAQFTADLGSSTAALTAGVGSLLVSTFDSAAGSTWRINGAAAGTSGTTTTLTARTTVIGANGSSFIGGGSGESLDGILVELMVWNRVLTTAEQAQVASYVQSRYGINTAGSSYSGTPALGGTGTLSAGTTANPRPSLVMGGTGTLSAAAAPSVSRAATLGGTGTLTATGKPSVAGAAALGGTGTLNASTAQGGAASPSLGGTGTLSVSAKPAIPGAATLGGAGTLTASGAVSASATASLGGTGTLTATGVKAQPNPAQLGGEVTLSASVLATYVTGVVLGGSGALSATGEKRATNLFTGTVNMKRAYLGGIQLARVYLGTSMVVG